MKQCKTCGEVLGKEHQCPCPKGDTTQRRRQAQRRAKLNKIAKVAGFTGWSAYETACIKAGKI